MIPTNQIGQNFIDISISKPQPNQTETDGASSAFVIRDIDKIKDISEGHSFMINQMGYSCSRSGTPQAGMQEYPADREFIPSRIVAHFDDEYDQYHNSQYTYGEIEDGSVFCMSFHVDSSCGDSELKILYAPNWANLLDNLGDFDLKDLIKNLNTPEKFIALLLENIDDRAAIKDMLVPALTAGQLHQSKTTEQSSFFRCL